MTFEDFLLSHEVTNCGDYNGKEVIEFMRQTWNAAKEHSKEIVSTYSYVLYNDTKYWSVQDQSGYRLNDEPFESEEEAEDWVLENGYRLE